MNEDHELLVNSAKAAGFVKWRGDQYHFQVSRNSNWNEEFAEWFLWQPHEVNEDAFVLAVALGIDLRFHRDYVTAAHFYQNGNGSFSLNEPYVNDKHAAARRAILRAAAEIGKTMP